MASIEVPIVMNFDVEQVEDLIRKHLAENDYVVVPEGNVDDIHLAIISLGVFRKAFCMNVAETDKGNEPVFRCGECVFENKKTNRCAVKTFLNRYATKEEKERFLHIME